MFINVFLTNFAGTPEYDYVPMRYGDTPVRYGTPKIATPRRVEELKQAELL